MSGFGGCNAAALYKMGEKRAEHTAASTLKTATSTLKCLAEIDITPHEVVLNGRRLATSQTGKAMLTELYKQHVGDYPKYYKMDPLARLGFMAAELLLASLDEEHFVERADRAIVFVNRSASAVADRKYEESIQPGENYFPSPGDFVYTLPNIVTGEIAIRHHYHGETSFLVLDSPDDTLMTQLMQQAFADRGTHSVLGGWLECTDENNFEAQLALYIQH